MTAASVYYVNTVMEPEDAIKGTGIFYHDLYSWLCDRFLPWRVLIDFAE